MWCQADGSLVIPAAPLAVLRRT
ncbi:hypothetical protein AVEN_84204-1, partial [Araneus ventricosus]